MGIALASGLALMAGSATAQRTNTVQELLRDCEAVGTQRATYCLGLVSGIGWILRLNCDSREVGWKPNPMLSAGGAPTLGAAKQAFMNWARANPQEWSTDAVAGVVLALREAFPCQE